MECVATTSFSLSINGMLYGYFKGKRGLCQGDPISPYLFTLVMEVLTLMLQRRVRDSGAFTFHCYCSKMDLINLCFADDLFLFAHGDMDYARVIMEALDEFKLALGLTPSIPKSTAYFCNVLNYIKISILHIMPFEEGRLPVKYLGVPLVSSRLLYQDCNELIEKVGNGSNMSAWFDKWAVGCPLTDTILVRDMYRVGFDLKTKLSEVIIDNVWRWPTDWLLKYLNIISLPVPMFQPNDRDCLEWRDDTGMVKPFSVAVVWSRMKVLAGLSTASSSISDVVDQIWHVTSALVVQVLLEVNVSWVNHLDERPWRLLHHFHEIDAFLSVSFNRLVTRIKRERNNDADKLAEEGISRLKLWKRLLKGLLPKLEMKDARKTESANLYGKATRSQLLYWEECGASVGSGCDASSLGTSSVNAIGT
ncbi:putative reverse transcriptase domain, reverse transcriptase zinc-binding domain protein, partial [Tanacetum coccineum]